MKLEEQVRSILTDISAQRDFVRAERDSGSLGSRSSYDVATGKIRAFSLVLDAFAAAYMTPFTEEEQRCKTETL